MADVLPFVPRPSVPSTRPKWGPATVAALHTLDDPSVAVRVSSRSAVESIRHRLKLRHPEVRVSYCRDGDGFFVWVERREGGA